MIDSLDFKKLSTWIILVSAIFIVIKLFSNTNTTENFGFTPWNMGTRFYPTYDLRGYPLIYPWNYPFPGTPYLYWSPYFYEANGKYIFDPKYAKLLNYSHKRILKT
jgi:hypothetical protein